VEHGRVSIRKGWFGRLQNTGEFEYRIIARISTAGRGEFWSAKKFRKKMAIGDETWISLDPTPSPCEDHSANFI
jgi:hypothetical protein